MPNAFSASFQSRCVSGPKSIEKSSGRSTDHLKPSTVERTTLREGVVVSTHTGARTDRSETIG
jgi:hypothetical protein